MFLCDFIIDAEIIGDVKDNVISKIMTVIAMLFRMNLGNMLLCAMVSNNKEYNFCL